MKIRTEKAKGTEQLLQPLLLHTFFIFSNILCCFCYSGTGIARLCARIGASAVAGAGASSGVVAASTSRAGASLNATVLLLFVLLLLVLFPWTGHGSYM